MSMPTVLSFTGSGYLARLDATGVTSMFPASDLPTALEGGVDSSAILVGELSPELRTALANAGVRSVDHRPRDTLARQVDPTPAWFLDATPGAFVFTPVGKAGASSVRISCEIANLLEQQRAVLRAAIWQQPSPPGAELTVRQLDRWFEEALAAREHRQPLRNPLHNVPDSEVERAHGAAEAMLTELLAQSPARGGERLLVAGWLERRFGLSRALATTGHKSVDVFAEAKEHRLALREEEETDSAAPASARRFRFQLAACLVLVGLLVAGQVFQFMRLEELSRAIERLQSTTQELSRNSDRFESSIHTELKARKLTIVDGTGRTRLRAEDGRLTVFHFGGEPAVEMGINDQSGWMQILNPQGKKLVELNSAQRTLGGWLSLHDKEGSIMLQMHTDRRGAVTSKGADTNDVVWP